MINKNDFYSVSGLPYACVGGSHNLGPLTVVRVGYQGRRTAEQVCSHCGASIRFIEYAVSVKRRNR